MAVERINTAKCELKTKFIILKSIFMKKKILGGIAVIAIAVLLAFNVNISRNDKLTKLSISNIDALAQTVSIDFYCRMTSPVICFIDVSDDGQTETIYQGVRVDNPGFIVP